MLGHNLNPRFDVCPPLTRHQSKVGEPWSAFHVKRLYLGKPSDEVLWRGGVAISNEDFLPTPSFRLVPCFTNEWDRVPVLVGGQKDQHMVKDLIREGRGHLSLPLALRRFRGYLLYNRLKRLHLWPKIPSVSFTACASHCFKFLPIPSSEAHLNQAVTRHPFWSLQRSKWPLKLLLKPFIFTSVPKGTTQIFRSWSRQWGAFLEASGNETSFDCPYMNPKLHPHPVVTTVSTTIFWSQVNPLQRPPSLIVKSASATAHHFRKLHIGPSNEQEEPEACRFLRWYFQICVVLSSRNAKRNPVSVHNRVKRAQLTSHPAV